MHSNSCSGVFVSHDFPLPRELFLCLLCSLKNIFLGYVCGMQELEPWMQGLQAVLSFCLFAVNAILTYYSWEKVLCMSGTHYYDHHSQCLVGDIGTPFIDLASSHSPLVKCLWPQVLGLIGCSEQLLKCSMDITRPLFKSNVLHQYFQGWGDVIGMSYASITALLLGFWQCVVAKIGLGYVTHSSVCLWCII